MKFPDFLKVFGDQSFRGDCPREDMEQITLVNRVRSLYPDTLGKLIVHIKNEGKRTRGQIMFDRASGMTKGAADIIIPGSPTLVCELKRRDHTKSRWEDGQIGYLEAAHKAGAFVFLALGADAAMEGIRCYVTMMTERG